VDGLDGLAGGLSLVTTLLLGAICIGRLDWEEACCRCRDHGQALCDSRDSREDFLGEFSLQ